MMTLGELTRAGGHAFPCEVHDGMTLRDYFAAHALGGIVCECYVAKTAAEDAYEYADAMLEVRKAKPAPERVPPAPEQVPDPFEPE